MNKIEHLYSLLLNCEYHCTICLNKIIQSGQLAKVAQNLRDIGYVMEREKRNFGKTLYCNECNRFTLHYRLVSPNKENANVSRISFPSFLKDKLINIYGERDNFTNSYSCNLEIDHRVPPKRLNEKDLEVPSEITRTEVFNRFQFLTKENNNIKREVCKRCIETDERGVSLVGIEYYYKGYSKYEGTCEGCFWAFPEIWREHLKHELYRKQENIVTIPNGSYTR